MTPSIPFSIRERHKVDEHHVRLLAIFRFIGTGLAILVVLLLSSGICLAQIQGGSVVAWGRNDFGQANYPSDLTNAVSVAIGIQDSLAVRTDGSVVGWGDVNGQGVIPSSATNVAVAKLGQSWNVALKNDGTTISWPTSAAGDTNIPPNLSDVAEIAADAELFLARLENGSLVSWGTGWNGAGWVSVTPPAGLTDVVSIATGQAHSVALRSNGQVVAWGDDSFGQTNVPTNLTNVVALAAGQYFTLALKADGAVAAWGDNENGQTSTPPGATNVVAIAAGAFHSLALRSDGTVIGWGSNSLGAIDIPADVSSAIDIAAGGWNSAAIINGAVSFVGRQAFSRTAYSGTSVLLKSGIIGISPSVYQWRHDGTNISGVTGAVLSLTNLQLVDSGDYCVTVTNIYGATASSNLNLVVTNSPPIIVNQPTNQAAPPLTNTFFVVNVVGSLPLNYQWQFNGTNIVGATDAVLSLTNLQLANDGFYDVVVSNSYGGMTSTDAYLHVYDAGDALDATNLVWSSGGAMPWYAETFLTHDGSLALQSGAVTAGQQSIIQTTVTGPGTLTFWWNVSSEQDSNYLSFSVNGAEQARISGVIIYGFYGWNEQMVYLGAGPQLLQWSYVKTDSGVSISGRDSGWLDQINFSPGGTAPFVTLDPTNQVTLLGSNVTLSAAASGTPPLSYQWQLNGASLDGATNTSLSLTNVQFANEGNYSLVISNAFGVTNTTPVFVNVVDFTESLNATNLTWITGGDAPWFPETSITHDGVAALQSGAIGANQQSTLQTTVNGPGTLSFWWKVSSETNNDYASFSLDGVEQSRISGTVNWQQQTDYLTPGTHTLLWDYSKNATVNGGSDAAWLDQVSYTNGSTPAFIISGPTNLVSFNPSNAVFAVVAQGTPSLSYQWQFNGTNIAGATNAVLSLASWNSEGSYSVVVSNAYGLAVSSNATLTLLRSQIVPWGQDFFGQTNIPAGLGNVLAISAGANNSMALKSDGTVVVWGDNSQHQTNVPSGLSNVVAIACGNFYDCLALKSDGTAISWGLNGFGKATIPAGVSNIIAIAAGDSHSMVLQSSGNVIAWGSSSSGQTNVPAGLTNAVAIAAGSAHSLALRADGTVVAWGSNSSGQTNVPTTLTNVVAIAACGNDSLALQSNGVVVAWGSNSSGQTNVPTGLTNIIAIVAGPSDNMALRSDGTVAVWGSNNSGQTNMPAGLGKVVAIAAGQYHCLSLLNDGPPIVAVQPQNLTNYAGFTVAFNASVLGLHPLAYQWQFDGTNISEATNNPLILANIQPTNSGSYSLVTTNNFGMAVSSNATLTVITNAPVFVLQPTNQTVIAGSNVALSVTVGVGPIPNTFQWQLNGTNVIGATNAVLGLTNVQTTNQGNYSVVVNNGYGTTTSSNAYLTVIVLDLPTALNTPGWTWTNNGSAAWFAQTNTSHDGFEAAQSGLVANGQSSTLQTTITGPGTLTFWWMFSPLTSPFPNTLSFSSSQGNASASVNSTTGWQQRTIYLGTGQQTLSWNYSRFSFISAQSTGWVDQVSFTPGGTPPTLTSMSPNAFVRANASVIFGVGVYGTPPLAYQWQLNGTNLLNKTNAFLSLTGVQPTDAGIYSIIITNSFGTVMTNATLWVGQFGLNTSPTNLFMSTNGFQLELDGILTTNSVVILGSTDLVNWLPLFTNSATTGSVQFLDVTVTNLPTRFYRAQE